MKEAPLKLAMITATIVAFLFILLLNEVFFARLEFASGINWIYLPAGVRLLCTLLFAEAGAIGLLMASWLVCFFYFFPNDPVRSLVGGILASAGPYLVYLSAQRFFGLQATLRNLSPAALLACAGAFSLASPFLHHLWFALYENKTDLANSFLVMAFGDFSGTVIVLYTAKWALNTFAPKRPSAGFTS